MARLLLVLGSRGAPVADLVGSLSAVADVTVLTSCDVLAERIDSPPAATPVIVAAERSAMVTTALVHPLVSGLDGVVSLTEDTVRSRPSSPNGCDCRDSRPRRCRRSATSCSSGRP
jgi:hypothetical protein